MSPRLAMLGDRVGAITSGGHLVIATEAGVTFEPGLSLGSIVAVDDELWLLAESEVGVVIHRLAGDSLVGEPLALPDHGTLVPGSYGKTATYCGAASTLIQIDDHDAWATRALGTNELAFALGGSRVATISPPGIVFGYGSRATLPSGHRVRQGAAVFDGSALCVIADSASGAVALVIGIDGVQRLRLALVGTRAARLAPLRGQLVVQVEPERLAVVDLRFGRTVAELVHHAPIADFAVDRGGYALAVLDDTGALGVYGYRDRVLALCYEHALGDHARRPRSRSPSDHDPDATVIEAPPVVEPEAPPQATHDEPTPPTISLAVGVPPPSLAPRPRGLRVSPNDAELALEALRGELRARCALAIARAWDCGRICFTGGDRVPCQTEVGALAGPLGGRAPSELATAREQLTVAITARVAVEAAMADHLTPLAELCEELALTPFERDVLVAIAGPELWSEIARLYVILGNETGRPPCDAAVLGELLHDRATDRELAETLAPDAPLHRLGLIRIHQIGRVRPALTPSPQLLRRLRAGTVGRDPEHMIAVHGDDAPLDALRLDAHARAQLRAILDDPGPTPLRLAIKGRPGSGRRTLLARIAAIAGRRLALIDAAPYVFANPPRLDALELELQRAHLAGWLPCIDGLAAPPEDPQLRRRLVAIVRDHAGPICFRIPGDGRAPAEPCVVIALPELGHAARVEAWRDAVDAWGRADDPVALAARWSVGVGTIYRALARAGQGGDLGDAVRTLLDDRLAALTSRVVDLPRWEDVVLPPELLDSLNELIARVRHRDAVLERWGLARISSTGRGVVALFQGGPGTGKTLVAGAIARELGLDVYRVDLARVVSKWIGETERNLGALFDAAEDGNAILLFDEADSLFARRTEVRTSVDRYANLEVNYLLQRLDSFTGIAILTSNFGQAIDEAFKRRLSFRLGFPFPDEELREQLWHVHLPPTIPRAGALDLATLASRHALAGGYIRNAALRAAFLAAGEGSALRQEHLERAIHLEYREIGRLSDGGRAE